MKKALVLTLVLALVLGMMAGCSKVSDTTTTANSASASVSDKSTAAASTAASASASSSAAASSGSAAASAGSSGKKLKVCWIPICTGIDYFTPIAKGVEDLCGELGMEYSTVAPDTADATSQVPYIEAQIQNGVDILLIAPNSTDALNATLQKAKDAGVTVLMVNDDITGNEQYREACSIGCNYDELAKVMFEKLAKDMDYKGEYVVISSTTDAPFQNNQIKIYKEMNQEDKYKDMKLVEIMYGNDEQNQSLSCAETAMDKYPDLTGMLCPTTVAVVAAAMAVSQRGVAKTVHVQGCGTPNQMRTYVKDGTVSSTTLWDTYMEGYAGALCGYLIRNGKVDPNKDASFDYKGQTFKFGPNGTLYAGDPLDLNKDTIDKYDF
jgi:rhamnose transport system substrate-binding protein